MPTPDFTAFPIPTLLLDQGGVTSTGSTTARTIGDRFAEVVNVKDFGAIGDGIADDSNAVQAAIDYAIANSIRGIFLPSGGYRTTKTIFVDHPGSCRGIGVLAAWSSATTYAAGDKVTFNGMVWRSVVAGNINHTPELKPGPNFTTGGNWLASNNGEDATGKFVFWEPSFSVPTHAEANIAFYGLPGQGRGDVGARILPNFNNAVGVLLGSANGMLMQSIGVLGGGGRKNDATDGGTTNQIAYSDPYRWGRGQPRYGVGVAVAGTGGSTRCFIEKCEINSWRWGILTGYAGDGLGDFNIFKDNFIFNCDIGVQYGQTQNFINVLDNTNNASRQAVLATAGTGANIRGGNFTTMNEQCPGMSVRISAVTVIDSTTLTAVFSHSASPLSPDPTNPDGGPGPAWDLILTGQITIYSIVTAHFGVVPLRPTGFNVGTSTMTLQLDARWVEIYGMNLSASFDLAAEITAATLIYGTEEVITFNGAGIHVDGLHVENVCPNTFMLADAGFGQQSPCSAKGIQFNSSVGFSGLSNAQTPQTYALYYGQMNIPLFWSKTRQIDLKSIAYPGAANQQTPNVDIGTGLINLLTVENCPFRMNPRVSFGGQDAVSSHQIGGGFYDFTPFYPSGNDYPSASWWFSTSAGLGPQLGNRPALYTVPAMGLDQFNALLSTPYPAIGFSGGFWHIGHPPLSGGQLYRVQDVNNLGGTPAHALFLSRHRYYSFGTDLPISWNCKGQSKVLNVSDVSIFFPGLAVILTTDITDTYQVTGVYSTYLNAPPDGYVTVHTANTSPISGVKSTVYSGATIGQPLFDFRFFDDNDYMPATVTVANLPAAASVRGARRLVSDATATTFWTIVAGGGANTVSVTSDGTNWRIA